ncbi:hypothetical protein AAMO2058_001236200 [Amorphochlora amoebiformis]
MEYTYKVWPWATELKLVAGDKVDVDKEAMKKALTEFTALMEIHGKKKSAKGSVTFDEIVLFCKDTGAPILSDQDFGILKPNKTTRLVDMKVWVNVMLKPLTKKKGATPPEYFKSLLDGVKAKVALWDTKMKEANEKRAKEKAFTNLLANLYISCEEGKVDVVKKILSEKKELINVRNEMRGKATPFMAASGKGQKEVCKALMEMKADVNAEDGFEWTALNWAISGGDEDMQKFLKDNGGELGAGDMDEDEDD